MVKTIKVPKLIQVVRNRVYLTHIEDVPKLLRFIAFYAGIKDLSLVKICNDDNSKLGLVKAMDFIIKSLVNNKTDVGLTQANMYNLKNGYNRVMRDFCPNMPGLTKFIRDYREADENQTALIFNHKTEEDIKLEAENEWLDELNGYMYEYNFVEILENLKSKINEICNLEQRVNYEEAKKQEVENIKKKYLLHKELASA